MTQIPDTRAAFRHYDLLRDPVDHQLDPHLPEDPGLVHSVDISSRRHYISVTTRKLTNAKQPVFADYSGEYKAECLRTVRVVLPIKFDIDDPDVCPQCKRWLELKIADPAEYERQRREWRNDRWEKEQEQQDLADWNRRNGSAV